MLRHVAAFELRYQFNSPLFRAAFAIIFLAAFADMSIVKLGTVGGGNVLFNAPHAIIVTHLLFSLVFLFLGAAFVSNAILRDDQTGFGPIIRSTRITKAQYLFGRFIGACGIGALVLMAVPLGAWLGTLMPFADQEMLGPNRWSGFVFGYGLFALPNVLIISAILFALAAATRSTAGTFVAVVLLLIAYLLSQRLMEGQSPLNVRVLADPLGMSAYMAASRYLTAAEINAGAVPVTWLMLASRLLWLSAALLLLLLTYARFHFADRPLSNRRQRKLRRQAAQSSDSSSSASVTQMPALPDPRFGSPTAIAQFAARAGMEARFVFKSPLFLVLLAIAFLLTVVNLFGASGWMELPIFPLASVAVPIVESSFRTLLLIIAAYYGGELVWREREQKVQEIIDATPLPSWALMLPKMLGLVSVLLATSLIGMGVGLLAQLVRGLAPAPGEFLLWYLLPGAADALVIAAFAVFVSALSPSKYAGWGIMFLYLMLLIFGPSLGLEYPLLIYGEVPSVPLSDMAGTGNFSEAAWWFRLFWMACAALLLIVVQLLWPRGTEQRLSPRLRRIPVRLSKGRMLAIIVPVVALAALSGSWIVYNTLVLNRFHSSADGERYLAEYEKRYFRYARLPQPAVSHVQLNVALYPAEMRAEVSGRYTLVNDTKAAIDRVHVRLMNPDLELLALDFPGARLERDDRDFDYRIYRLDRPMRPGETRSMTFRTSRRQHGFRAGGTESAIVPNGTDIDTLALTPRIGMSDAGLIEDPAVRRKYGLPEQQPLPRLDDLAATQLVPSGGDAGWTTVDMIVSTSADQLALATGKRVSERVENGRRIARFVSTMPVKNLLAIQSGRFAVRQATYGGVKYAIYYDPAHRWNVDRMMTAMRASIAYYSKAFGPYQFDHARIVENPYGEGGHAYPGTLDVGESVFALDLRDPQQLDMVTMLTAHEMAHQWWGHQVLGARMQGGSLLYETLAQYSALMVLKRLRGDADIRRYLRFQLDRYLSGRRTQVLAEQPLASVEIGQQHIAYGKGALALYLLQDRLGEAAVNRALRRFADRYRFTVAPYPRSLDLIAMLRAEAKRPEDQALITDLFERITLYDLKVSNAAAVQRADGKWDVTVPVEAKKFYADGKGDETAARLGDIISVGLFTSDPAQGSPDVKSVVLTARPKIRSGRQLLRFVTNQKPLYAAIDPDGLYIDRDSLDNVAPVMLKRSSNRKAAEPGGSRI